MFKRDVIKELHKLGVRRADKVGVGSVSLEHIKNADLCNLLARVR